MTLIKVYIVFVCSKIAHYLKSLFKTGIAKVTLNLTRWFQIKYLTTVYYMMINEHALQIYNFKIYRAVFTLNCVRMYQLTCTFVFI